MSHDKACSFFRFSYVVSNFYSRNLKYLHYNIELFKFKYLISKFKVQPSNSILDIAKFRMNK